MKKTNKILSVIILVFFIISIAPASVSASTSGTWGENLTWSYDSSTYTLTISGSGVMDGYVDSERPWENYVNEIKSIIVNDGVTSIGCSAFKNCRNVTHITLPDSITTIEKSAFSDTGYFNNGRNWDANVLYIDNHLIQAKDKISGTYIIKSGTKTIADNAFYMCNNLQNVIIPDSVVAIGSFAFNNCWALRKVAFGNGVISIGDYAFFNCDALGDMVFPNSLMYVGNRTFDMCDGIKTISIPDSVISIGEDAFNYCRELVAITVDNNNQYYSSDEYGVLFNKDKTKLIEYPMSSARTKYKIPDSVVEIGTHAFYPCDNLISIDFGDGVTTIGAGAFSYCTNVIEIIVPDGVTTIGDQAFYGCSSLANVVIGDGVVSIGNESFYNSDLYSITIPVTVKTIGHRAFAGCKKLTEVYYNGVEKAWNKISVGDGNEYLLNATIYFKECQHNYIGVVEMHTCTENGCTTYTCECGESYVGDYVDATGHIDSDDNGFCDVCTEILDSTIESGFGSFWLDIGDFFNIILYIFQLLSLFN